MCRTGKSNCRAAKMVVASTYKLSYLCSAESTVREGVKAAKSIDASGKNGDAVQGRRGRGAADRS